MPLADQARSLRTAGAQMRQDIFGTDDQGKLVQIDYNRGEFSCDGYYSPVRRRIKTGEAGFMEVLGGTVRLLKTVPFVPEKRKQVLIREKAGTEIKELLLTIMDIGGNHPASVEWVLTCEAQN